MPSILVVREGPVLRVTLNRPEVRNAFDEEVIRTLTAHASEAAADRSIRAVVLAGAGQAFCAGADLAWMSKAVAYSHAENLRDAEDLARMLERLDMLPMPLLGRIHGPVLGGGVGLAAVCDIVVASEGAIFGLTEVRLGILPAIVSPYVVRKIGISAARELFITGTRFGAVRAREIGLVHDIVPEDELDDAIGRRLREILASGPMAVAAAKSLIQQVAHANPAEVIGVTTNSIAAQRVSPEGQEGMRAFLEKRKPKWSV